MIPLTDDSRLSELMSLCRTAKRTGRGRSYGRRVHDLVRGLLDGGMSPQALVQATGLSTSTIRKWASLAPSSVPVRILDVTPSPRVGSDRPPVMVLKTKDFEVAIYPSAGDSPCFP